MKTLARFSVEEILPRIGLGFPKILLETSDGEFIVKASSPRLECLKRNQTCVWCRRKGNIFLLQQHVPGSPKVGRNCFIEDCPWCALHHRSRIKGDVPHLNLYHQNRVGGLILMTQDHIYPQWAGGNSEQENLQTMCRECNQRKGGDIPGHLRKPPCLPTPLQ